MEIVYFDVGENIKGIFLENHQEKLEKMGNFKIFDETPETDEEAYERIKNADGIFVGRHLSSEVIEKCDKLKIISFIGYGVKNYLDLDFINNRGIAVTNTPNYGDDAVAEHALTLLLSLTKNIVKNHNNIHKGIWIQQNTNIEVNNKTIGLIGLGSIGKKMATLCKNLGMNVICWTRNPDKQREMELGIKFVEMEQLLKESDFVSLHLPYHKSTERIIGEKELSMIKPGSIFINTARAELVCTNTLVKQLKNGRIFAAGIDVYDQEPIKMNNPLLNLENVILSPHVGFNTPNSISNMINIAVNNLESFFEGKPKNLVK